MGFSQAIVSFFGFENVEIENSNSFRVSETPKINNMNRPSFLQKMVDLGLLVFTGCQTDPKDKTQLLASGSGASSIEDKKDLISYFHEGRAYVQHDCGLRTLTMANIEQMPAEHFTFKYTPETMSFGEQWRH